MKREEAEVEIERMGGLPSRQVIYTSKQNIELWAKTINIRKVEVRCTGENLYHYKLEDERGEVVDSGDLTKRGAIALLLAFGDKFWMRT